MHTHVDTVRTYVGIFAALLILTVLTVAAAFVNLVFFSDIVAIGIAVTKATLIVLFFMHVRHSSQLTKFVLASTVFMLLVLVVGIVNDYITRWWLMTPGK